MSAVEQAIKIIAQFMSEKEEQKLQQTLDDISRNTMIRSEVMAKRNEGQTVRQACRDVGEKVNLEPRYVENIYYGNKPE